MVISNLNYLYYIIIKVKIKSIKFIKNVIYKDVNVFKKYV